MKDNVERLAKVLYHQSQVGDWIRKSDAVNYVRICPRCEGTGTKFVSYQLHNCCLECDGKGIVPLKEPNGKD